VRVINMGKFLAAFLAAWVFLVILSLASSAQILPIEVLKIKDINSSFRGGEYRAIEQARMEISEATDDEMAQFMSILPKSSPPDRAYGCVSPMGWKAYVSQDAVTSWKGPGLAAYALWS
jgi:hypothetical protein